MPSSKSLVAAGLSLAALGLALPAASQIIPEGSTATPHYGSWGFDLAGRDPAVKPGDDFFEYANGAYVKALTIPSDKSSYGNFTALYDLSQNREKAILEAAAAKNLPPTTPEGKIGAFYKAFMDEGRIEALDAKPIQPELAQVRAARTREAMAALMGAQNDGFFTSVVALGINPDEKDPDRYAVYLSQAGLGLPDRDYYLQPSFAEKKAAYQAYVAQMLGMGGWGGDPAAAAKAVVDFETQIAQVSWTRIDRRNPDKTYNPVPVSALAQGAPGLDWATFLKAGKVESAQRVIEQEPTAIAQIAAIYGRTPVETLQAWQAFHVISSAAPLLSKRFVDAQFAFYGKTLSGTPENEVRWKRAANTVEGGMGEAVGEVYVAKYFPPASKAKMVELTGNLRQAFRTRINGLAWMSPATKTAAIEKLDRYTIKIGYPAKFRDYSALQVSSEDLVGDAERAGRFEWNRQLRRMNGPVDKAEWGMTPQTVNAYNNPVFNEVVFPAAILQPPFFDPNADDAINYGAIVGVIGHEMTHGFDDEGRKYDASGRLRDWWTAADAKGFEERAARLGAQYDTYQPLPGVHVQGKLTMGENIADQGGLSLALDAYHTSLHGKPAPVIGGLTGDQRVFLGWAQVWRAKMRDDARRQQIVVDPHSPEMFRVNGVVRNIDGWYKAFDVKPGDKLYVAPQDRAMVW
jgi:putative endopeptidase